MECGKVRSSVIGGRGEIEELLERSERGVCFKLSAVLNCLNCLL